MDEYYNATIGMSSNDILEYGIPGEVHNNYTNGYGVKIPRKTKVCFKKKEIISADIERQTCRMG